jgi:hypothetical protein
VSLPTIPSADEIDAILASMPPHADDSLAIIAAALTGIRNDLTAIRELLEGRR